MDYSISYRKTALWYSGILSEKESAYSSYVTQIAEFAKQESRA
jgi:hypothetical protein